jgi:hypothetical protein
MHVNARHHSVAIVAAPVRSMHHLLVGYRKRDRGQCVLPFCHAEFSFSFE